eukprot:6631545-Prymnesium_polylepis.1
MRHEAAMREMAHANEQLHAENKGLQAHRLAQTEEIGRVQAELRAREASDKRSTDESHSQAMAMAASRHEAALKQLYAANEQLQAENKGLQAQRLAHAEQMQRLHAEV